MSHLKFFFEAFRFIKRWRERTDAALSAERAHQIALIEAQTRQLEIVLESGVAQARETATALIEIAKANASQSEVLANWLKMFQGGEPPTSSAVAVSEDAESFAEALGPIDPASIPADLPEEFRLALALRGAEFKSFTDSLSGNR